jgi:O-antigen ligase
VLLVSPYGGTLVNLLPFIGTTDAGGVEYRQQLFEASLLVMKQNPWFGGGDYIGELAALGMVQGEGIVDLVNTYLAVALTQGLVGLGLFAGVFASAAAGLLSAWRRVGADSDLHRFGRALLAALAAALAIIATMSPILCVPTMYWLLAGLCVAYAHLAEASNLTISSVPGVPPRHTPARPAVPT